MLQVSKLLVVLCSVLLADAPAVFLALLLALLLALALFTALHARALGGPACSSPTVVVWRVAWWGGAGERDWEGR